MPHYWPFAIPMGIFYVLKPRLDFLVITHRVENLSGLCSEEDTLGITEQFYSTHES